VRAKIALKQTGKKGDLCGIRLAARFGRHVANSDRHIDGQLPPEVRRELAVNWLGYIKTPFALAGR
jgi:hypothetical protein